MSASGLGFLSFWLLGQMRVFVGTGAPRMWSFFLAMVPFLAAIVVGVTRITDYWHNVSDVCFGLLLGYGIALVCYLQASGRCPSSASTGGACARRLLLLLRPPRE